MPFDEKLLQELAARKEFNVAKRKKKKVAKKKRAKYLRDWGRNYMRQKRNTQRAYFQRIGEKKGRKRKYVTPATRMPFDEFKQLLKDEGITTRADFLKWVQMNSPVRVPSNPNIAYIKSGWRGWKDLFGENYKPQDLNGWTYRPLSEAKIFVKEMGITSKEQWIKFCASGKKPDDIPTRPDLKYRRKIDIQRNEVWISWNDFFGQYKKVLVEKRKEITQMEPILMVLKPSGYPDNVFIIDVVYNGRKSVIDYITRRSSQIVYLYNYYASEIDLPMLIQQYGSPYWDNEEHVYLIQNPAILFSELSQRLQRITQL